MTGQPATFTRRDRPVVLVHVGDEILGHVAFPVPRRHGVRVHAAAKRVHRVRHHEDHFARGTAGEDTLGDEVQSATRRTEVTEIGIGVAVQEIDDRVAA